MVTKNEIDFILVDNRSCMKDVKVLNQFDFESNHRLLRMKFALKTKFRRPKNKRIPKVNPNFKYDDPKGFIDYNNAIQLQELERNENDYKKLEFLK